MQRWKLAVADMHCGHCVGRVRAVLSGLDGVRIERVEVGLVELAYQPDRSSPASIAAALAREGYSAVPSPAASPTDAGPA